MEIKLKELFGHNMQETGREGGEINFTQFTESFEKSQFKLVRLFWIISPHPKQNITYFSSYFTSFIVLILSSLLIIRKK